MGNVLVFYLPTARPDRSAARQPMLQSFPRASRLPRNHAPPVRGAAKQPLLQTFPGPTLEVAFRVSIGCKYKTRTKFSQANENIVKRILWKSNPRSSPSRSLTEWAMLQPFPEAPVHTWNHMPHVRGAAEQPLLQTVPGTMSVQAVRLIKIQYYYVCIFSLASTCNIL